MKLYEYLELMPEDEELTVFDKDYDIEIYFHGRKAREASDEWDMAISDLSKLITVEEIRSNGVIVNLSEVIEKNINKLQEANLFIDCDVDVIMSEIERDIAGYVSDSWMRKFVNALKSK